jgi:hypothetical protein
VTIPEVSTGAARQEGYIAVTNMTLEEAIHIGNRRGVQPTPFDDSPKAIEACLLVARGTGLRSIKSNLPAYIFLLCRAHVSPETASKDYELHYRAKILKTLQYDVKSVICLSRRLALYA